MRARWKALGVLEGMGPAASAAGRIVVTRLTWPTRTVLQERRVLKQIRGLDAAPCRPEHHHGPNQHPNRLQLDKSFPTRPHLPSLVDHYWRHSGSQRRDHEGNTKATPRKTKKELHRGCTIDKLRCTTCPTHRGLSNAPSYASIGRVLAKLLELEDRPEEAI